MTIDRALTQEGLDPKAKAAVGLQVLFVVGSDPADPEIQAGMEYLGLVRRLDHAGISFHSRVLLRASSERVKAAIKSFKPSIVHFICHGDFDDQKVGFLRLTKQDDTKKQVGPKKPEEQEATVDHPFDQVRAILRTNRGNFPQSSCSTHAGRPKPRPRSPRSAHRWPCG